MVTRSVGSDPHRLVDRHLLVLFSWWRLVSVQCGKYS